jgi:hypothetical protein
MQDIVGKAAYEAHWAIFQDVLDENNVPELSAAEELHVENVFRDEIRSNKKLLCEYFLRSCFFIDRQGGGPAKVRAEAKLLLWTTLFT